MELRLRELRRRAHWENRPADAIQHCYQRRRPKLSGLVLDQRIA